MTIAEVRKEFNVFFKERGFTKQGGSWYKNHDDTIEIIEIEPTWSSKGFNLDFGIFIKGIDKEKPRDFIPKRSVTCHLCNSIKGPLNKTDRAMIKPLDSYEGDITKEKVRENAGIIIQCMEKYNIFELLDKLSSLEEIINFIETKQERNDTILTKWYLPKVIVGFCRNKIEERGNA